MGTRTTIEMGRDAGQPGIKWRTHCRTLTALTLGFAVPHTITAPTGAMRVVRPTTSIVSPTTGSRVPTYTVTVPTRQLLELLQGQVFADSGRFYPCRSNPSCSAWGQDIVLTNPAVSLDGPRIVFSVHMTGSYAINQFFAPTVTGDLVVSGVPIVRGNKVAFAQTTATAGPASDVTFRTFLQATHTRVESMLDQSPGFDFAQYLAYASSDPQLPPPRLPDIGCVDRSQIQVQSVTTRPAAAMIDAIVAVSPGGCKSS